MKNNCVNWKEQLLDSALSGNVPAPLQAHLQHCDDCKVELNDLRLRREKLDALLPLTAQGAEVSAGFRGKVLGAVAMAEERRHERSWLPWAAGLVAAAVVMGVVLQWRAERPLPQGDLVVAEKLAQWRAPSDLLLQTPGREMLRSTPKLGESYLKIAVSKDQEKSR